MPENTVASPIVPFYVAHAVDPDLRSVIRYKLSSPTSGPFRVDPVRGYVTLTQPLDYETTQRYAVALTAVDESARGEKNMAANMTLFVEVQDVNDNAPVFERPEYTVKVEESAAPDTQVRLRNDIYEFAFCIPIY